MSALWLIGPMRASQASPELDNRESGVPPRNQPARGLRRCYVKRRPISLLRVEKQRPVDRVREMALERPARLARGLTFRPFARQEQLRSVVSPGLVSATVCSARFN